MATWGSHIRIAEKLLDLGFDLDEKAFLIGNLGPDCNQANEDWSEFEPPKKITHWFNENGKIDSEKFYDSYLRQDYKNKEKESFLIGYYAHLLSDIEWSKMLQNQNSNIYDKLKTDEKFIWKVKKDWYDLDHMYFKNNKESIFYRILKYVDVFPEYLEFFPENSIITKIKYIVNFYEDFEGDLDREYNYLTKKEMDSYIDSTTKAIEHIFNNREITISKELTSSKRKFRAKSI
ncbi:zinc dependent phospholipase C family protein [Senegalia massiliensis]|uniref:zinc dependent phospholipase C family protein n=1 Tax=Senegalia massiliensis TaxID=1720316 RepID=UPI0010307AA9|nr:zinc dependent phospholipase C family protein [Senegalia massiliensis]